MRIVNLRVVLVPFLLSALSLSGAPISKQEGVTDQLKPGVVVERVAKSSDAEKAGVAEDDIILHWSRGDNSGPVDSPLDVSRIEIEQLPLGPVTLAGFHGAQEKTWVWTESKTNGMREGDWGITTRPNLTAHLLSLYEKGREAAENGRVAQAVGIWQSAATDAQSQHLPASFAAWFLLRSAQALAEAKEWQQAETTCWQAVQFSTASNLASQLLAACGYTFFQANQQDRAEKYYQQALTQVQETSANSLPAAAILNYLSRIAYGREDLDKAQKLAEAAMGIYERVAPHSLACASSYNRVGFLLQVKGELEQSEQYFRRTLALREQLAPWSPGLAQILQNLGDTLTMSGDLDKAKSYLLRSLQMWEKLQPDSGAVAACLIDMSNAADGQGELAKAEEYLRRALAIQKRLRPRGGGAGASLNNLGLILQERGQLVEAEAAFQEALAIKEELAPGSFDVAHTLGNLGDLFRERGDLPEAEKYLRRNFAIVEKVAPKSIYLGIAYTELGDLALQRQEIPEAEDNYKKALAILEVTSPGGREAGDVFHNLGDVALKKGDVAEAEKNYMQALEIRERRGQSNFAYSETLIALAEVARRKQQWELAGQRFQQGLDALERQTARLGGAAIVRAGFRARYENSYKSYVDLLVSQARPDLALNVLERSRARILLETLAAARVDIREGVDGALLGQERILQADITAKSDRRIGLLSDKHSDEQLAAIDKEIKDLLDQYTQIESQIRESSPRYAALTQPQPLAAEDVQRLLDTDTVLLEYSLGEERSYVFAVTTGSVVAHVLPQRAEIERVARSVYASLTARNRRIKNESISQRQTRVTRADSDYPMLAGQLSKMVLGPVAAEIHAKRLLIVSDGTLQYIPFSALPAPGDIGSRPVPLMIEHEIVNLPSASIVPVLRRQERQRNAPTKTVAVLADPVFSPRDGRVGGDNIQQSSESRSVPAVEIRSASDDLLTRSMRDVGLDLARLPFTRLEAETIFSLAPRDRAMKALDFNATRAAAISTNLSQYRIVHFATHGLLDSQQPELSGLVLSLVDKQGKPQGGFLSLEDIYNLDLPAELVVLSACETGLGKEIRGEGLIGLTRGFMYAGASRVMASLWSVNDVATAELMGKFYQGVLRQKLTPAAALRNAQRALWQRTRWKSPYYWAAFQLQGDWK